MRSIDSRLSWIFLLVLTCFPIATSAADMPQSVATLKSAWNAHLTPEEVAVRVAATVLRNEEIPVDYRVDFPLQALLALGDVVEERTYLDFVQEVMTRRKTPPGYVFPWQRQYFASLSFDLFLRTRDENYAKPFLDESRKYRAEGLRTSDGVIGYYNDSLGSYYAGTPVHKFSTGDIYLRKEWEPIAIDQAQEYASRMAKTGCLTSDESYFTEAAQQFELLRMALRDPKTGLWGHARGWFGSAKTPIPTKWGRGHAWVLRGLVEALTYMPSDAPQTRRISAVLREFAETLLKYQDDMGFWHQVMDRSDSYQETSATGMISYYFARGVRQKLLDEKQYRDASIRAFEALLRHKVSAEGVVYGGSKAATPMPSVDDYLNWGTPVNDPHAVAAVIYGAAGRLLLDGKGTIHSDGYNWAKCGTDDLS